MERTYKDKFSWLRCSIRHALQCKIGVKIKIDSTYKQSKNYYHQVYVEECKYIDAESQQCNMLSDSDDNGYFEV